MIIHMDFFHIGSELVFGFIALLLFTKILGKTVITQVTTFDFVCVLVIGELVGNAMYDQDTGIKEILYAVIIWGTLIFLTEFLTQKFRRSRGLLEGKPSIIIQKGKIDYEQLKKNHLDLNQLQHLLRTKDIFSIKECHYAILETDGTINTIKKQAYTAPVRNELQLPSEDSAMPISLILDGEIIEENLTAVGWDKKKLLLELSDLGIHSQKTVLYAEWHENAPLYVQNF